MTIEELIQELQKCDKNQRVIINPQKVDYYYYDIDVVIPNGIYCKDSGNPCCLILTNRLSPESMSDVPPTGENHD